MSRAARLAAGVVAGALLPVAAQAAGGVQVNLGSGSEASYLRLLLLFASVSLAPAVLAVLTSFVRIIVVLFFLRAGLGSAQIIPNPVLFGFAIILTVCTMGPSLRTVQSGAVAPLLAGKLTLAQAGQAAEAPLRAHLRERARPDDLALFERLTPAKPGSAAKPGLAQLAGAYVLSELRAGFLMGFVIYLPFLVIDLVVAGTLASLGLFSLPQAAVALPFKILLFVMVDGWRLLTDALLTSLR